MATVELKRSTYARLYVEYSTTYNIDKNQSTTVLTMKVDTIGVGTNIGPWGDWNGSYLGATTDTFNGEIPNFSGTRTLKTTTKTVTHKSDGTADPLKVYWKWGVNSSWGGMVIPSGNFDVPLPTIPRATQPTLSAQAVQTGEAVTINTPRASSGFTHTLKYSIGSASNTIATGVATSYRWTVPRDLANQFPNSLLGDCTIECITYSGSTVIGSKTVKLTLQLNTLDTPSIRSITATEKTEGLASKFGAFIRGQSKVSVEIKASGIYGSTIKSYSSEFQGTVYTASTFEASLLSSGQLPIKASVTDSRGIVAQLTRNISVLDYLSPTINLFAVSRCDASGVANDDGTYAKVDIDFVITSLNEKNDKSYKVEYKPSNSETWLTMLSGSVYSYKNSYVHNQGIFDTDNVYDFRLTVSDYFGSVTATATLASANVPIDFYRSGRGVAIGKVAQFDNLFDVGIQASFDKQVDFLGDMISHGPARFMGQVTFDTPPSIGIAQVNNVSINDIRTPGTYYLMNNVTDRPVNANGWLEVFTFKESNIYQRYTTYTGKQYERIMDAGQWQQWCGYFEPNNMWRYLLKIDGTFEATGIIAQDATDFNTVVGGGWYRPQWQINVMYPIKLASVPTFIISPSISATSGGSAGGATAYPISPDTEKTGIWVNKIGNGTANLRLGVRMYGKWK